MTWKDHGVPMGIVGSPQLFSEIVPEVDSEKTFARAEVVARVRSVKKKRAVFAGRVIVAMKGPDILVGTKSQAYLLCDISYLAGIRIAPSRRRMQPLSMLFSKAWQTRDANSVGSPNRCGNGIWATSD